MAMDQDSAATTDRIGEVSPSAGSTPKGNRPRRSFGDKGIRTVAELGPRYKWVALVNTTLGMLMVTINQSIVLIALPDIFRGIAINPLDPASINYLLWMMMGFMLVSAVLVVGFGRLGDMYGRARMYNLGFAIFTASSIFLTITWTQGPAAALWLIGWRIVQAVGGALLFANSSAILTDAFPINQRGLALGINGIAATAGSFIGLIIGGVLAPVSWRLIFLVSVPVGVFGTIWAYVKLHDTSERRRSTMDWWGNITFAVGLIAILMSITYAIQPYGGHPMGWASPGVLAGLIGGAIVLVGFVLIERRVAEPLFKLSLFRIRAFAAGNVAALMAGLARGGFQFILIIWLQGIWLPLHGTSFEQTPLWAGIYMIPMTVGFLIAAPISGVWSDRLGPRLGGGLFTVLGLVITAVSFAALVFTPVDFDYWLFAGLLLLNGIGNGMFNSPNRAQVMNSLPADSRGAGSGMNGTFTNSAFVLSIGIFFSLMISGLATHLPSSLTQGLTAHGVPAADAHHVAALPPVSVLFASFLGYNPIQQLLGGVLGTLPSGQSAFLTGREFFPQLISAPFSDGLTTAFSFAILACVIGVIASFVAIGRKAPKPAVVGAMNRLVVNSSPAEPELHESLGAELELGEGIPAFDPHPVAQSAPAGVEVVGSVRMPNGSPVPGAVITATAPDGHQAARSSVTTGGAFRLRLAAAGPYTVIVGARGYAPDARTVIAHEREAVRQEFVLSASGSVRGTVCSTATGQALPSASVLAVTEQGEVLESVTADEFGRFHLRGIPLGPITISANAPAHQPAVTSVAVALEPVTVDLRLAPVGGLIGVVRTPDGHPVAAATITVLDESGRVVAKTSSDADGNYRLPDVPAGLYSVVATLYQPVITKVRVRGGDPTSADLTFTSTQEG